MTASARAQKPSAAMAILAPRTLANSHPTLLPLLRPDTSVLDVGCGPGGLTREIARLVDPGHVVGMDANPEMIQAAEEASPPGEIRNLIFYTGDIRESAWDGEFDVVNAARTLQWIPDVGLALRRMARAVAPGGWVVVLDYDHTRAEWNHPPAMWARFHEAFLGWREAAGLDNAIAGHLPALCEAAGLVDVAVTPQVTTVRAGDGDFFRAAGHWRMLVESRGRQMVAAGWLREAEREDALEAFGGWMQEADAVQTLREACVVARRP
ncbi:MAG TPA: methyltransferase domain-containing protein [Candidatus Methylomirabilis sp.]|nr:methyltransferase domain-containing protein [Candidatus Methylomirabilis sp.]